MIKAVLKNIHNRKAVLLSLGSVGFTQANRTVSYILSLVVSFVVDTQLKCKLHGPQNMLLHAIARQA